MYDTFYPLLLLHRTRCTEVLEHWTRGIKVVYSLPLFLQTRTYTGTSKFRRYKTAENEVHCHHSSRFVTRVPLSRADSWELWL